MLRPSCESLLQRLQLSSVQLSPVQLSSVLLFTHSFCLARRSGQELGMYQDESDILFWYWAARLQ